MAEMKDSTRRLIMMLTIILAGTAVTFLELSPVLVLVISLVIGIVMLFGLNILSFDELKKDLSSLKDKLNQPVSFKKKDKDKSKEKKEKAESKKKEEKEEKKGEGKEKSSLFSGIFQKIRSRDKNADKTKKIDEILDKTINEEVVESDQQAEATDESEIDEDDFSDFDSLDLGLEEDEGDIDSGTMTDMGAGGIEDEIPDSTIAEILAKEGIDFEMESDDEFPDSGADEDESGELEDLDELDSDISGFDLEDDELEEFDEIDLDEIETDEEIEIEEEEEENIDIGESEEEPPDAVVEPPEESDDLFAAPPKEWSQTKAGDTGSFEEPETFAYDMGGDEDDLFAMLKSDTKKEVNIQDLSLLRDLKDAKVETRELVDGLESVLTQMGAKIEKIDEDENSNSETESENEDKE